MRIAKYVGLHTDIKKNVVEFINDYDQHELRFVIAFCVGFYGAVDETVWEVIRELISEEVIV